MTAQVGGFQVVIDPGEWFRLKQDLDEFDPALARALRRRIRSAGDVAAEAVRAELALSSPDGGPDDGASRAALAAATKVSVSFSRRTAGAQVATRSTYLAEENKGLLKVYNMTTFRHPVFGDPDHWVEQQGRPYFGGPIQKALDKALVTEIRAALDEAVTAIGGRGK